MKKTLRPLTFLSLAGLFVLISTMAAAQSGSFLISQHGHPVGDATVTFTPGPQGYNTTSVVHVSMKGLEYQLSKTEQLTPANALMHAQVSAAVNNTAVNVTAAPDSAQILLNISASGHTTNTRLALHRAAVFLPDFDPGAYDTLLALAATRNNSGLWAIIPKQAGSIAPIQLATYADLKGTLNGNPVTVHHLKATIAGANTDLFSGPTNQLLQAELPEQGFALVRKGFVLTPPAKPGAPPAQPPPGQAPAGQAPSGQAPSGQAPPQPPPAQ